MNVEQPSFSKLKLGNFHPKEVDMAEEEPGSSTGEEHDEEEAPAAAPAAADPKQDDVKPVIFIGLFIATLFTMGIVHCL